MKVSLLSWCIGAGFLEGSVDVVLDLGGYDVETELLEPLQKLLDQCKSAKVLSKWVSSLTLVITRC